MLSVTTSFGMLSQRKWRTLVFIVASVEG